MSDADVNAKLSSIVTLLKAVGVDGGKGGKTLDDDQIQAIIRKLQNAQAEAPQIIAALEAHASRQPEPPQPQYEEEEDEEEEDDDDANYPMVGPGCSDDISVVSDLTTPTVVSSLNVADEEHYKETLPPMLVGSMLIAPTKRKNLVNNPRTNVRKSGVGGAAAQRRKHYNATMEKLKTDKVAPAPTPTPRPSKPQPSPAPQQQPSSPKPLKSKNKAARRASLGATDNNNAFASSWNAFESTPTKRGGPSTLIDDDGFLMSSGGGFEAFNPFQDETFAQPMPASAPSSTKKKSSKSKKSSGTSSSKPSNNSSSNGSTGGGKPQQQQPQPQAPPQRRARRASLAM